MSGRIRPWNYTQCVTHFESLKLHGHFEATPKILDVGFGKERRSTLALRKVFPTSEIVAIDNDLRWFEEVGSDLADNKLRYLFSDVDLLEIPGGRTYDLVVFCMSLFCLQNPLRAIGTIASSALRKNGLLLITQRNDSVMRALSDLPESEGTSQGRGSTDANSPAQRIRRFWGAIKSRAKENRVDLVAPWRFRLICSHEPLMAFITDLGFKNIGEKQSGTYPALNEPAYIEKYGAVLGGPIDSDEAPQYSVMQWAWRQFRDKGVPWPQVLHPAEQLNVRNVTLCSRLFKLETEEVVVSNHPFSTYTAPLKIVPAIWSPSSMTQIQLEHEAKKKVSQWIADNRTPKEAIKAFYLLSPHGVAGHDEKPKPLPLFEQSVEPLAFTESPDADPLALSRFLEKHDSPSTVIQFYRLKAAAFWPKNIGASTFLDTASHPVMMLAFPIILSAKKEEDLADIKDRLIALETRLGIRDVLDTERRGVANYLRSRGEWMKQNNAYGIYYYYRKNPSADNKPVSRGASILVTGALPIETTLEFLVMADEVISNYQSQRYVHLLQQRREFGERAARAGILVRNLSHHMGSHVLVHRQLFAQEVCRNALASLTNQCLSDAVNNLAQDSRFYTYIRERMEFLGMLSLDAQLWTLPVKVADLFSFFGEPLSKILLHNIGANEKIIFKSLQNLQPEDSDLLVALPWGTTGFHAFYTLIEGVLRNACKHGGISSLDSATPQINIIADPDGKGLWLYCGVPEQQVSASDAASAILAKINAGAPVTGDPVAALNGFLSSREDKSAREKLWITKVEGGYAHGAFGVMEMAIAAEFLSCGANGLRTMSVGGKLCMGFMLAFPKEMCGPLTMADPLPSDFCYEWDSYVVDGDPVIEGCGLPPKPLGARTLYITDHASDSRFAHVSRADWNASTRDYEATADMILRTRYKGDDFQVIVDGHVSWQITVPAGRRIAFVDEAARQANANVLTSLIEGRNGSRTLILAHNCEAVTKIVKQTESVVILPIGGEHQITRLITLGYIKSGKWDALRLMLYEAAFLKYEIYDDRLYSRFHQKFDEHRHIAVKQEASIVDFSGGKFDNGVMRIVHLTGWHKKEGSVAQNDWRLFYPNLVFHTARGGEASTLAEEWDSPRLDYSSVDRALECAENSPDNPDLLIRLALLTVRRGCEPARR
ncbi:MAG: class I SAM-dependent methyltransferase [Opitutaceae bacterium]|jgi:SAM-dependent methyltransferase